MIRFAFIIVAAVFALAVNTEVVPNTVIAQTPPTSGGAADPVLLEDLVAANRILANEGVLDAYGHVSVRHPGNPNRYLMSRSLAPILVTVNDIVEYDLDSTPVDLKGGRSVLERFIHGEIFKARQDVNAVIHSHSPAVIPFGITQAPMRPVYHMASFLHVGVPVWDIRVVDDPDAAGLLVRNGTIGTSLASTLSAGPVVLMRGHGNVVVASSVQTAVARAIYTEVNARLQTIALGLGGPVNYISSEEGAAWDKSSGDTTRGWDLWKKQAFER